MSAKRARFRRGSLVRRLYEAADKLSRSCGDNFGTESADNGEYERFYSESDKDRLDEVLKEFEKKEGLI